MLAPAYVAALGELPRQREVVEPLDVHHHRLAGPEDHVGLDGAGPACNPLRRVAGSVVRDDEQMVHIRRLHHGLQCAMPPGIFGIGEAGIFLRADRLEPRRQRERHTVTGSVSGSANSPWRACSRKCLSGSSSIEHERTRCSSARSAGTGLPSRLAFAASSSFFRASTMPRSVGHRCSRVRSWIGPMLSCSDASCMAMPSTPENASPDFCLLLSIK